MISQVALFLVTISTIGIILLKTTTSEKRYFVLLPAGIVWGVSIYIFLLNLTSKLLPGKGGIILATILLFSLGLGILIAYHKNFKLASRFKLKNLISLLIISGLVLTTIYLARLKMTAILPVADSNMQWAYAASFARGNYPLKVPWQPDLNPNYHLGAYFLEGAILSIFKIPLITIHAILNTYFLIAGALFAMFIFWETKYSYRNFWHIIATLVLYLSFGVFIFLIPGQNFDFSIFTTFPADIAAKGTAGAALVDLNSLSYLPARSLSLGLAFLALYFTFAPFKKNIFKILSLSLSLSTIALVEESMFLPIYLTLGVAFIGKRGVRIEALKILLLTTFIVAIQGGFLSEFLSQKQSAFNIYLPFRDSTFLAQLQRVDSYNVISDSSASWFIASPLWLALIISLYSFITRNKPLAFIGIYSILAILCFIFIEYKYSPSNNIRFYNFAFISAGCGFIYLLFSILKARSISQNFIIFSILTPFILIPTLLPELLNQQIQINEAKVKNVRSQILIESYPQTPFEEISSWASKHLPINSRLISLDTDQPNPNRSLQFQYKGIYTILGPQYIHTIRPEPGIEYFDLYLTLNPTLLKQTKTEYVYIESESLTYQNLPPTRKDDLANNKYFQLLSSVDIKDSSGRDIFYRLYKVLPQFLDENSGGKEIKDGTLIELQGIIPNKSSIYIADYGNSPKFSFWYRMALILALRDKDIRRTLSQTDYQAIETEIPYNTGSIDEKYDFYILSPNEKLSFPAKLVWSNLYGSCWKRQ